VVGVALALIAASGFAASNIFGRLGLQYVRASGGVFLSLLSSLALVLAAALIFQFDALLSIPLASGAWFALAGVMNFPVGRFFKFLGMRHIGTSRATAVSAGSPLFAVIMAVVFLSERLTLVMLAGTLLIVGGLFLLAWEDRG
jgi:drug/metabolite transporter (DMT)-like permease